MSVKDLTRQTPPIQIGGLCTGEPSAQVCTMLGLVTPLPGFARLQMAEKDDFTVATRLALELADFKFAFLPQDPQQGGEGRSQRQVIESCERDGHLLATDVANPTRPFTYEREMDDEPRI